MITLSLYHAAPSQPWLASLVVVVAEYGIFLLPLALVAVWFASSSTRAVKRRAAVAGCIAAVVAGALGLVLERVVSRPRPFIELGIEPLVPHAPDSSFPSDHTLVGVALVGALALTSPRLGVWLVAWALVVGFARVAAGLHHPSDILGSAVLALVLDLLALQAVARVRTR